MVIFLIGVSMLMLIFGRGSDENTILSLKKTGDYDLICKFVQIYKSGFSEREFQSLKNELDSKNRRIKISDPLLKKIVNLELKKTRERIKSEKNSIEKYNIINEEKKIDSNQKSTYEDKNSTNYHEKEAANNRENNKFKERYTAKKLRDMGCRLSNEGKYGEAIEYYDRSILANPNYAYAWYKKGIAFLNVNRYQEGIECFEKTRKIDPNLYFSLVERGDIATPNKKFEKHDTEKVTVSNKEKNTSKDKDLARNLFDTGCSLSDNRKHKEAIEYYDRQILAKPYHLEAWLHKGTSFYERGMNQEAIECFDKALLIESEHASVCLTESEHASVWLVKGACFINIGMNQEAIECFDKATLIEPNNASAWRNKGVCLFILGRYQEAIEVFDVAISFQPRNADFWYVKGGSLCKMEKYQEAIECFDKVISVEPNNVDAWYNKGVSLLIVGRNQEAMECFDLTISAKPNHAYSWHNKGTTFFRMGRYEEAIRCYEKTKNIDSKAYFALVEDTIDEIDKMKGYDFEKFTGALYKKMGYTIKHTSLSGDQGADLIISKCEERSVVQIKRHTGKVSNKAIQEVVASKGYYKCNSCIVVTNSYFTKRAIELGNANDVKLIDRDEFKSMIKNL